MFTRTATPLQAGPQIVFFGIANSDGCFACDVPLCNCGGTPTRTPEYDAQHRQVFTETGGRFLIVVEARPGTSGQAVCPLAPIPNSCAGLAPDDPSTRPDLQIEGTLPMGNGDPVVDCQTGQPASQWGGIAAVPTPSFDPSQSITDALQDFACRFGAFPAGAPCTLDGNGNQATISSTIPGTPLATTQFCDAVATNAAFPFGESVLTVQVRDRNQNIGPTAQIVVRIVTPTPTP